MILQSIEQLLNNNDEYIEIMDFRPPLRRLEILLFRSKLSRWFGELMSRNARHLYRGVMDDVGPLPEGAGIADIGCGHGTFLCMYANQYPDVRAFGLDQSAELIKFAENQCKLAGVAVEFMVGDVHNTPLPENTFDIMVSCSSIYLWEKPVGVLNRLYDALKTGGRLLVYDELPVRSLKEFRLALFNQRLYGLGLPAYSEKELKGFAAGSRFGPADVEIDNLIIRLEMTKRSSGSLIRP